MSRCRWFRLKPLTSVWLNVELAGGWDLTARLVRITLFCLLLSSLSSRASNRSTGEEMEVVVDVEESSELWTAGSRHKGLQESGCETSHPDVIFHSSSILDPPTHLGLLLLGTCDVHPSSFQSGFSRPFYPVHGKGGNNVSAENVCGQCRALPLTPRRSCCTDSFTFSTSPRLEDGSR